MCKGVKTINLYIWGPIMGNKVLHEKNVLMISREEFSAQEFE